MKRYASMMIGFCILACSSPPEESTEDCTAGRPVCVESCGSEVQVPASCGPGGGWVCVGGGGERRM